MASDSDTPIPGTILEEEVVGQNPTPPAPPEAPEEPVEPETPPEETPIEPETPPAPEEPETPEEPPTASPRANKRIQDLTAKLADLQPKATPAAPSAPTAPTTFTPPATGQFDFRTELDTDPATLARIEAEVERRRAEAYNMGITASQNAAPTQAQTNESLMFRTRVELDAPAMETKYPILDKDSSEYDQPAAKLLNDTFLNLAKYDRTTGLAGNPALRYSDFIEAQMELAEILAARQTTTTQRTVARQAAKTGLRPTGTAAKGLNLNASPKDATDEELEAIIAADLPALRR